MNRRSLLLALAAAPVVAGGMSFRWQSTKEGRQALLIAGASAMFWLNQELAKEFIKSNPSIDVVVEKGGSLPGLIALKRGAIDLAAMDRDLTVAEDDLGTRNFLIARSNVTIVVNKKSPIKSLSSEQIRALFAGDMTNWKQAGGPDAPVHVISRTRGSTARQFVEDVVLSGSDITVAAREVQKAGQLIEQVAADPYAIGYLTLKDKELGGEVAYLAVDGVAASRATILSGRYPYTHSLYLLLYGDKQGAAADFVAFARSPAGQKIVEQQRLMSVC